MPPPPPDHPLLREVAGDLLRAVLARDGVSLTTWTRTKVHPRGSSLSVRFRAEVEGADEPVLDLVGHTSEQPVPPGAAVVRHGGQDVHVWRLPHDPYLPGLPAAMNPDRVRELMSTLGQTVADVGVVLRAYRPTRRAVIEVRGGEHSVAYLKLLGGRADARRAARAEQLAEAHRAVIAAGLPGPPLLGVAARQGLVVTRAVAGVTLRTALVHGKAVPDATELVTTVHTLAGVTTAPGADPRAFADPTRHLPLLTDALPEHRAAIAEAGRVAQGIGGPVGTVHGDLHDGQILIHRGELAAILDLDGLGEGYLAHDLGRLVAYLDHAEGVTDDVDARARVATFRDELVAASDAHGVPDTALAAGAAAAWLGLATNPLRTQHEGWREEARNAIERARWWGALDR